MFAATFHPDKTPILALAIATRLKRVYRKNADLLTFRAIGARGTVHIKTYPESSTLRLGKGGHAVTAMKATAIASTTRRSTTLFKAETLPSVRRRSNLSRS